jgi:hypothetical protein
MPGGNGVTRQLRHAATATAALLAMASGLALVPDSAPALASPAGKPGAHSHRAGSKSLLRAFRYRGYRFEIPASWPVISDLRDPATCVRFDLHAVYLGVPGANQNCPSWLLGATEAVLIEPGPRHAPRTAVEDPVASRIFVTAPGMTLTATFDTNPGVVYRIIASAGLPAPVIVPPNPARLDASYSPSGTGSQDLTAMGQADVVAAGHDAGTGKSGTHKPRTHKPASPRYRFWAAPPELPAAIANDVGLGFDVCAAPSADYMSTWRQLSPYRAIGIYIGGSDRACDQQNLTPGWLRLEAASGWRFVPLYAGAQAAFGQISQPGRQGAAAASDAVQQAERLGFGANTPLYYDMEAYPPGEEIAALSFLSAWTSTLHKLGYLSGVYSSSDSGIANMAGDYHDRRFARPDVIFDALWNGYPNASDAAVPRNYWAPRRLHQYTGNVVQTYGGDTMQIDQDYLDLDLATPGGTVQAVTGTTSPDGAATVFYEGVDHQLWEESRSVRGAWARADLGGSLSSPPSVVQIGRSTLVVLYRNSSDVLTVLWRISGKWLRPQTLPFMGPLGGPPRAVAQPNGVIDVFWSGYNDKHLWHGEFNPGEGWSGPQPLHGSLASAPYPVETPGGVIEVFWEGRDGRLWRVTRRIGIAFTQPEDLGMAPMGGPPHAVVLSNGEIDVFWRGNSPHSIWAAFMSGQQVRGPVNLGGQTGGAPWPVTGAGTEDVFFRGLDQQLWLRARTGGQWRQAVRLAAIANMNSAPFAAAGSAKALTVFWVDSQHRLWAQSFYGLAGWHEPVDLGGQVQ